MPKQKPDKGKVAPRKAAVAKAGKRSKKATVGHPNRQPKAFLAIATPQAKWVNAICKDCGHREDTGLCPVRDIYVSRKHPACESYGS